jgi:hypothetical protein
VKTDHWFYGLFQSAPDLITLLLPQGASAAPWLGPALGPDAPGDALYRFEAPELKAANHRLDGAFWPISDAVGTPEQPVVLLEVQMHSKRGFKQGRLKVRHKAAGAAMLVLVLSGLLPSGGRPRCQC